MCKTAFSFWQKAWIGLVIASLSLVLTARAQPAAAQAEEPSANEKAMHYSLYYEDYKNESFASALPNLRWILEHAPTYPRNDDRNYERAWKLYEGLAEQAEDEETARTYLDSALVILNTAVSNLEDAGAEVDRYEWARNKGRFIQSHLDLLPDKREEAVEAYRKAFEAAPDRLQSYYINAVIQGYVDLDNKQAAIDFMSQVEEHRADDAEVMEILTDWRGQLFTSPEERYAFIQAQLENDPENLDLLREKFELEQELGHRTEMFQTADRLIEVAPTAKNYHEVGMLYLDDGEPRRAFEYFQQAVEAEGGDTIMRDTYYNMGVAQRQMEQLSRARTYFRRALEVDPQFGRAYIAIGDLYVSAVAECSDTMGREDRAVYWLAVDYYERARSTDSSVANEANQKINTYRRYFPDQEALFFKGWEPGQSYSIDYGCYSWIGETTTVRQPS